MFIALLIVILVLVLCLFVCSFLILLKLSSGKKDREEFLLNENTRMREFVSGEMNRTRDSALQTISLSGQTQNAQLEKIRDGVSGSLEGIRKTMDDKLKDNSDSVIKSLAELGRVQEDRLNQMRQTIAENLQNIRAENTEKLEKMRVTVDEKLQSTLEKRLGESFKIVSERLEQVYKGLGEMQNLASGVGDLKRVLTNVKVRGTWGEIQLRAMLEEVLTPEQYSENVSTKKDAHRVEFAVKLPGRDTGSEGVLLPIDAKFPIEDYQRIVEAAEKADPEALETASKQLEIRIKACAKDIFEKYLNPPDTTDFAILYLPMEGLFAEAVRRKGLSDFVQRNYRVVIAGPTTLWSILNSLQMGFRTLAIEKRSSEVWKTLEAVKTEWLKYADALDSVQKKLQQASDSISQTQVRVRAVGKKLAGVGQLESQTDAEKLLDLEKPGENTAF